MSEEKENPNAVATAEFTGKLYRHKTVRRFRVGGFEFKNFELRIKTAAEDEAFKSLLEQLPVRDTIGIVEINEQARKSVESKVVRGAMSVKDILTAKDRDAIQASKAGSSTSTAIGAESLFAGLKK